MGVRKYKRQIAKARLKAIGVDKVNRRLRIDNGGGKIWRKVLADAKAHDAQAKGRKPVLLMQNTGKGRKKTA